MTVTQERGPTASGAPRLSAAEIAERLGRPTPTPEQAAVVEAPLEPLLVVAGAGSGKTETMAARVVQLIANGDVDAERVLGLTFTRKAAGELSERVRHRLRALRRVTGRGPGAPGAPSAAARLGALSGPTIATYNSYAAGLVSDHALRLGLEPSARLLGEAARWQLAHDVVERWGGDLETDYAPSTITEAVLDLAGELAEHLVEPADLRAEAERLLDAIAGLPEGAAMRARQRELVTGLTGSLRLRARLVDLVEAFTERKRATDALDFSDQVALAARLAREVPGVGAAERARFDVVLLDEYQDTSVAQLQLLRHLFGGGSPDAVGHPVTAVGDPHQSIYGWRGASAGNLARFPTDFPQRADGVPVPARIVALATSWRNDRAVLDAANLVATPLREAAGAARHRLDLPVLRARGDAGDGAVTVRVVATQEEEARAVADWVHERWTAGRRGEPADGVPGGRPVTAAVLCRARSQFPALQAALLARGLPVEVVGLGGLLSAPEVVDLVAALEAAHDPSRGDSLMRLLTGPRARLGLADVHALGDWASALARTHGRPRAASGGSDARSGAAGGAPEEPEAGAGVAVEADVVDERSLVDALDELPPPAWVSPSGRGLSAAGRERLADLARVLTTVRGLTALPVVDLVVEVEQLLGLDIEVAARTGRNPSAARANLDAFRAVAASFSDTSDVSTLGAFLAWLDAAQREERGLEAPVADPDPDAVQLLTVHAAKGLEWDVVAVPGLVDGTFPTIRAGQEGGPQDSGWTTARGAIPGTLRGDRDSVPDLDPAHATDLADLAERLRLFRGEVGRHLLSEERRLAYVALTRARSELLLTASWWRDGSRPRVLSPFLLEVAEAVPGGTQGGAPDPSSPGPDGEAPLVVRPEADGAAAPVWPVTDVLGERQRTVAAAADAVRGAISHRRAAEPAAGPGPVEHDAASAATPLERIAELLLAERRRGARSRGTVELPRHLSASSVVRLAQDPDAFALQLRRPVPLAPSPHARRGTAFHAWVEAYYGSAALVDVDALPGADDETVEPDAELAGLQARFLASPWSSRTPVAIEVDVETPVGGVVVRSRIDAVFPDPDRAGGVVVVDWKTGRPPTDAASAAVREVQLAVYRLSWSRWRGVPLDDVRAAFFYAATGETVEPTRLLGEAELDALLRRGDG